MEELGNVLESILMWAKIAGICGLIGVGLFVFGHWGNSAVADASETQHEDAGPELQQTESTAPLQAPEPAEANDQPPPQSQSAMDASIAEVLRAQPAPAQPAPVVSAEPVAAVPSSEPPCAAPPEIEVPAHRKHHGLRRFFGAIGHGFKVFGKSLVGR